MSEIVVEAEEVGTELEVRAPAPVNLFRTEDPNEVIIRATETADALAKVIRDKNLTKQISGKNHVLVEGWTLLGTMLGVFPVCVWTKEIENGWEARVEARTLSGAVVGAAEAQCTRSENLWKSRDDYALRSMAQTRATSKALKQPLGFVVTLAGFETTPAEEMPHEAGAPTAAAEKPLQKGTAKQIGLNTKLLNDAFPEHPGTNQDGSKRTWKDMAIAYMRDRWQKDTTGDLTEAEGVQLKDWLEEQYRKAQQDADIPFESEVEKFAEETFQAPEPKAAA